MTEPEKREYIIPDNCPEDIELMAIWAQAYRDYSANLTHAQIDAAVDWFHAFIKSELDD